MSGTNNFFAAFCTGTSLLFSGLLSAQIVITPVPPAGTSLGASIEQISHGGNGCPQDSDIQISTITDPKDPSIIIVQATNLLPDYSLVAQKEGPANTRKNCTIGGDLKLAAGTQAVIESAATVISFSGLSTQDKLSLSHGARFSRGSKIELIQQPIPHLGKKNSLYQRPSAKISQQLGATLSACSNVATSSLFQLPTALLATLKGNGPRKAKQPLIAKIQQLEFKIKLSKCQG